MIDFISESLIVIENNCTSEMFVFVFREFDFEVELFVIIHVFLNTAQFRIVGYVDYIYQGFIRDMVVFARIVVR